MQKLGPIDAVRQRVGFVCEGIIQYMPLIGWYRRLVCEDVFVMRSFKQVRWPLFPAAPAPSSNPGPATQDAGTIKKNCNSFHDAKCKRMLFLSPEGVVCDFGERDKKYISECRDFAQELGCVPTLLGLGFPPAPPPSSPSNSPPGTPRSSTCSRPATRASRASWSR